MSFNSQITHHIATHTHRYDTNRLEYDAARRAHENKKTPETEEKLKRTKERFEESREAYWNRLVHNQDREHEQVQQLQAYAAAQAIYHRRW
jgi:hypothetical protein